MYDHACKHSLFKMAGKQSVPTKERKNEVRRSTANKCRQKNLAHTLPSTTEEQRSFYANIVPLYVTHN